jgi:Sec7-like guanine-nucleotide exchange factor
MLQTDLHNPQVKKHMTMEEFVRNNRGIDNNKDLPRDMLEEVYCNIRDKKVRRCRAHGAESLSCEGWLERRG